MIDLNEIMEPDQVAELLHLKRSTVINYFQRGVLPGKKLGKHWIAIRSDLAEAIEQLGGEAES